MVCFNVTINHCITILIGTYGTNLYYYYLGINDVFVEAVRVALNNPPTPKLKWYKRCMIM